jgi:hypothetical protein
MKILIGLKPADVLAGRFKDMDLPFIMKVSDKDPTITVLDGDNVVGYSIIPQIEIARISKLVTEKYWYEHDERVFYPQRKELFNNWVLPSAEKEKTFYLLWWVLDEIREIIGPLTQACQLVEKELIKYVLAQQKEAA